MTRESFDGNMQVAWDSTSLKAFNTCPRYYQYTIVEGWKDKGRNPHLHFGTLFHLGLELFDHVLVERPLEDADVRDVLREVFEAAGIRDDEGKFIPWVSDHKTKNMESLVRSLVYYYDQFKNDAMKVVKLADGRPAVELGFRFDMQIPGLQIQYSGHLDRVVDFAEARYFLDRKTTSSQLGENYFLGYNTDPQMLGYTAGGRIAFGIDLRGGIIDAAQIGVGYTRFRRHPLSFTEEQLSEWHTNASIAIKLAAQYAEANYWPMNPTACGNYGGCPLLKVCSRSPNVRSSFLNSYFKIDPWDPLKPKNAEKIDSTQTEK